MPSEKARRIRDNKWTRSPWIIPTGGRDPAPATGVMRGERERRSGRRLRREILPARWVSQVTVRQTFGNEAIKAILAGTVRQANEGLPQRTIGVELDKGRSLQKVPGPVAEPLIPGLHVHLACDLAVAQVLGELILIVKLARRAGGGVAVDDVQLGVASSMAGRRVSKSSPPGACVAMMCPLASLAPDTRVPIRDCSPI